MVFLGVFLFSAAFGIAAWTIFATIAPQLDRIGAALARRPQPGFQPLTALVIAERRIAVRRWAAHPRASARFRAAA